jgi:hypothetical protein
MAKPTKGESTPEYKKINILRNQTFEAWFPIYDLLKITDNSQTVHHDFPCALNGRQASGALFSFTTYDWGCYRVLLRNILPELLQNVNLQSGIYLWYIYVGTPLHLLVPREFLNNVSPEKRKARGGPSA